MFAEENGLRGDPRLKAISDSIRVVPHFPKPGIMFQDITTLLLDHKAFKYTVDIFVDRYKDRKISVVAGVEARGFMFGPSIALAIGAKFVPLRKPRKLPGEVISEPYVLEYGTDCLEMHIGAVQPGESVVVVDDLVATGGTLSAAIRLLERVGAEVIECACVIGLPEVKAEWDTTICSCRASPIGEAARIVCWGKRVGATDRCQGGGVIVPPKLSSFRAKVLPTKLGDEIPESRELIVGSMVKRHTAPYVGSCFGVQQIF